MSVIERMYGTFPTAGAPIDYAKRPQHTPAKCPGCGSLEFQDCEKGLVCSYCRVVIRPKAKAQDLHVHAPYVTIDVPVIKDPEVDDRLTRLQEVASFQAQMRRALRRIL